jgi:hypothetical protein
MTRPGWQSIFEGKSREHRYQGIVTEVGSRAFEAARKKLAKLAGNRPVDKVSDGDVFEALARGWDATKAYIEAHER